jgi:hypothetical protein
MVPVSPDEFNGWLKETEQACRLELLWAFADSKAERLSTNPTPQTIEDAP